MQQIKTFDIFRQ